MTENLLCIISAYMIAKWQSFTILRLYHLGVVDFYCPIDLVPLSEVDTISILAKERTWKLWYESLNISNFTDGAITFDTVDKMNNMATK